MTYGGEEFLYYSFKLRIFVDVLQCVSSARVLCQSTNVGPRDPTNIHDCVSQATTLRPMTLPIGARQRCSPENPQESKSGQSLFVNS